MHLLSFSEPPSSLMIPSIESTFHKIFGLEYPHYYPPVKNRQVINQLWNFGVTKLGNLGNYMIFKLFKNQIIC